MTTKDTNTDVPDENLREIRQAKLIESLPEESPREEKEAEKYRERLLSPGTLLGRWRTSTG